MTIYICLFSYLSIHTVCSGQDSDVVVHGQTVEEILKNAHNEFCGCQYITENIHLEFLPTGVINDVSLVEANFSFFNDIKEVHGYVFLSLPAVDQVSFPNLRIIRGRQLVPNSPSLALAVSGKIQSFYSPLLTEISAGGVFFGSKADPTALCNVVDGSDANGYGVHWDDILNDNGTTKVFQLSSQCTGSGMLSLIGSKKDL